MEGLRLTEDTLVGFADSLAAKEPVPGGGGAAAYAGALAAALCSMVGSYTVGKRRYAEVEDDVRRLMGEAEEVRGRLVALVDADAAAFEPLSRAYGIPRGEPGRADVLEEATRGALEPPLVMMRECCRAVSLLEEMGEKGSRMLLSDVGVGALLARAALEAASLNVFVNTKALRDRAFADAVEAECDRMLAAYVPRAEALAELVGDRIRGRA